MKKANNYDRLKSSKKEKVMEITGEIITIIYTNKINSYTIAEIETDEEVVTVVG